MQPSVQLAIPRPCHEDWQKMTPSQQGRFCSACAREVVDFTTMSDNEVLYYFLHRKNEAVCGRMYPGQLNRPVTKKVYPRKKKFWYWNYAAMFLMLFQKSNATAVHGGLGVQHSMAEKKPGFSVKELYHFSRNKLLPFAKAITGQITNEDGDPVPFATIKIKGSAPGVTADANGSYRIEIHSEKDTLQVSAAGYETYEQAAGNATVYNITLKAAAYTPDENMVVIAGGISSDYHYTPAASAKHVAVFEVLDNATHQPVKATLNFSKTGDKEENVLTDAKGIYKLKRIDAHEVFTVTVKAAGYLPVAVEIKGWTFNEKKATKYVFLEKAPVAADYKNMEGLMMVSYGPHPNGCRHVTGAVSYTRADTVFSFKKIVQDTLAVIGLKRNAVSIAPNPVAKGGAVTVSFSVKQSGNYLIQVTNAAGQLIQQEQVFAGGKNNTAVIYTKPAWGSGMYYLRIAGAKNNVLSTNSFIVQ